MSATDWVGQLVRWDGQLWEVTGSDWTEGTLWLHLRDHYGMEATDNARACDVEVALQ